MAGFLDMAQMMIRSQVESSKRFRESEYGRAKRYYYSISPKGRYQQQRASARKRKITFNLTFDQWWSLWQPYWEWRGSHKCQYVMARTGDIGPYELGNVRIDSPTGNVADIYRDASTGRFTQ